MGDPAEQTCKPVTVFSRSQAMPGAEQRVTHTAGRMRLVPSRKIRNHLASPARTRKRAVLLAVEAGRRMPGGSQSQLMRAEDGNHYVVKFPNNPQGIRILANEMLGAALARLLGLPVPQIVVIRVIKEMIRITTGMVIELGRSRKPCQAGLCCGSLIRLDARCFLPCMLSPELLENPADFLGMIVFDKWTGNTDGRQVSFVPNDSRTLSRVTMIDQGYCFAGQDWAFRDGALQGISYFRNMYRQVAGLEDFEPWLNRLEREINFEMLKHAAESVPPQWYRYDHSALCQLLGQLDQRRGLVRALVRSSLQRLPDVFPGARSEQRPAASPADIS